MSEIELQAGRVGRTTWGEYWARFFFGGLITSLAGYIASEHGPAVGGLFLAFPAVLPAGLTLVQRHQGTAAAARHALGAAAGSAGLAAFALVVWRSTSQLSPWLVLLLASLAWFAVSVLVWLPVYHLLRRVRARPASDRPSRHTPAN